MAKKKEVSDFDIIKAGLEETIKVFEDANKNGTKIKFDTVSVDEIRIRRLEKTIKSLDTAFEKGDDCIDPYTHQVVLDNEYDALKKELQTLNPKSKILTTVTASKAKASGDKVIHDPAMTSINKCNGTEPEKENILTKFFEDCRKIDTDISGQKSYVGWIAKFFCMSFKHDGLALSLEYENGILKKAGLRSKSGKDGIDVTEKTRHIQGIPQQLPMPLTCKIRGEVETTVSEFADQCDKLGDKAKANPRAHTAGSMNQKTAKKMKDRGLRFTAYNILQLEDPPYTTEIERAEWATRVLKLNFVKTIQFSYDKLKTFEGQHRRLDFKVDGVVISINDLRLQAEMGTSGNKETGNPKGKIAWKFKDEVKLTTIKDIVWQTGRTGNVTPVLIIDPLRLEDTTVTKCTAHNWGIVKNNKIGIGSEVQIIKSGKIIPKLHKVAKAKGKVEPPAFCPSCGDGLLDVNGSDGAESLVCDNADCPAQNVKNLYHYLKTLGCKGIAESTINKLVDAGLVSKRSDFYKLTLKTLLDNGFTERTSVLILARAWMINAPEQEKNNAVLKVRLTGIKTITVPMEKFFASFGMDGAGKEVGRLLSKRYKDFDKIRNLTNDELETVDGIGWTTANSVTTFFSENKDEVDELLKFVILEAPKGKSGKLDGKKFVLSGSMDMGKEYWRTEIENNGGEVKSGVGKKIDFLVAGDGSGLKSEKADELGIPILDEEALEKMLKGEVK
jgi:DNA ligase (NAD+)